nr:testis- and ovary-specific PAZ domain-containing protein 1 [Pogona vitticeps]
MAVKYKHVVDINLEDKKFLMERKKLKDALGGHKQTASIVTSQNTLASQASKKRGSTPMKVELHRTNITIEKNCMNSLLEPEQITKNCVVATESLRKKLRHSLVKSEHYKEDVHKEDRSSVVELKSQKVTSSLQESSSCSLSEQEPQQKTWNLRKTAGPVFPEQKASKNQDKNKKTKRRGRHSIQHFSRLKCKGKKNCKSQLPIPENCSGNPVKARWSSVSHFSGNLETTKLSSRLDRTQRQANSSMLRLTELQEPERKTHDFSVALTITDFLESVEVTKQKSRCLLKCVENHEEIKKCRSGVEKEMHRMITRGFLKSKLCENNSKKLNWKPKMYVSEVPDRKKDVFANSVVTEQAADCFTEDVLVTRIGSDSKQQIGGKEEFLTSTELKKESRTSRKQTLEVSNIQLGKLSETVFGISQDCSIQNFLEQSAHHPVSKSDETENKDPVSLSFGKVSETNCALTNTKCPQLLDIKVAEKKSGVHQDEEVEWLSKHGGLPHRVERIPVVRLHDCCYIKALLKPTGIKTIQNYRDHFRSLHVVHDQGKVLPPSRGMGQNDSNSSSNVVQPGRYVPEKSILVKKEMCQNSNKLSEYQNGKRFRESKRCVDKKPTKKIRISKKLEKSIVQNVFTSTNIQGQCGLQIKEEPDTLGSSVLEIVKCDETTCLSSLDCIPDFQEQCPQTLQNQIVNLLNSEKMRETHLVTCNTSNFEKSAVLRRRKNVLELESTEPQTEFSSKVTDTNSLAELLVSGKISSCDSIVASGVERGKRSPTIKRASKTERNFQPYSCQRAVPISGKNVWPRESCARTSLWFHDSRMADLEKGFLRSTDSSVNPGQTDLHEALTDTRKGLTDNITDVKIKESPTSESVFCIGKVISTFDNKNRFTSMGMERPKRCTPSTKMGKQSKVDSESLGKDAKSKGNIIKGGKIVDKHSSTLVSAKGKMKYQKISVVKQEMLLQKLHTENLSDFRIPILKDKNETIKKEYATSPEKSVCSLLDILEDPTASVRKGEEALSGHQFQSQEVTSTNILEEHANQFNSDTSESNFKEGTACKGKLVCTSLDSKLETSTWKDNSSSFTAGDTKNQTFGTVLASEIKSEDEYSNYLTQEEDNFYADVMKAYENDVLVIDVIQDDPDLFGDTEEQESSCNEEYCTENKSSTTVFSGQEVKLEPEVPQLPGISHWRLYPREVPIQDCGTMKSVIDVPLTVDSLSGISSVEGKTESSVEEEQLIESDELIKGYYRDEKCKLSKKIVAVKEEKANIQATVKIENAQHIEPVSHNHQLELPSPVMKTSGPQLQSTAVKPWTNDCRLLRNNLHLPSYPTNYVAWKKDKTGVTNVGLISVPNGYCRSYFNTLKGCGRTKCWYWHVPKPENEKFFSEILEKYISIGEAGLLKRAVQIFTNFYKEGILSLHFNSQVLNDLLISLLQSCLLKELFYVVHTCITIKILPTVDILLRTFEQVASMNLKELVPDLIDVSCKLVDAGMILEYEHVGCIRKFLNQLQLSSQEITTFTSRFQGTYLHKASLCDFTSAVAEFQHCKEKGDWARLGTLYVNLRRRCENFDDLEKYSLCIADILTSFVKEERPAIPFCEFAAAVNADAYHNEADRTLLGRIGISVMFSYYRKQQWLKARKVLDVLHTLKIPFTFLKGLLGPERLVSRCCIVNVAVEIFLKCGSLDGAIWVLRESEWVINSLSWPCNRMDVLSRHNLLCTIASEYITKSRHGEAFEVLQNLPGFQNSCDSMDVSQYSFLFNKLLGACLDNEHIGISSTVMEFMFSKNIPVEFKLLRAMITSLGRSCMWLKARTHYKSALALGCYPPQEGNLYHKRLLIPSFMSEIEMLLGIEIFLVSNASSIQSPGAFNQILQIVLKRCEGHSIQKEEDYQSATERLIQAARISSPKLFIKLLTVNVNKEKVYSLKYASVLKWLKENMKWAGKVWLF